MYAEYIHFFIASMMSVFGIQVLNQVSDVIGFQYPEALFYQPSIVDYFLGVRVKQSKSGTHVYRLPILMVL